MMAATHRLGGLAAGMMITNYIGWDSNNIVLSTAVMAGAFLGSLVPDIDNGRSSISRKFRLISYMVTVFQAVARGLANLLPARMERKLRGTVGHRGITHSLIMCVALPGMLWLLSPMIGHLGLDVGGGYFWVVLSVMCGMLSHLFLDMLSGGVPLLCPFTNRRFTLAHWKTGGIGEWAFRVSVLLVFIVFCGEKLQHFIHKL